MDGWILLHKKIWDSENFKHLKNRPTVILVWIWLLTHANKDGKVTFGYRQIAEDLEIGSTSVFRAVTTIKSRMTAEVEHKAERLYSTIYILNWQKYQRYAEQKVEYKRNASGTQAERNKEYKEYKEIDTTKVDKYILFKNVWKKVYGKYPTGGKVLVDYPIKRLIEAYNIKEICGAIVWAEANRKDNQYIPSFNNPLDLERKWNSLINQFNKERNKDDYLVDLTKI